MKLQKLLENCTVLSEIPDIEVDSVAYHIDEIKGKGTAFFYFLSYRTSHDWNDFINKAIDCGTRLLILDASDIWYNIEEIHSKFKDKLCIISVVNLHQKISYIAAKFFGNPERKMEFIGVTGTNGKTSTAHIIAQALNNAEYKVGIIGSIGHGMINDPPLKVETLTGYRHGYTIPPATKLFRIIHDLSVQGANIVVMEVTSHSLVWNTVLPIPFSKVVFTNISDDHLEYHGHMFNYVQAKKQLFDKLLFPTISDAIINMDDSLGKALINEAQDINLITYTKTHQVSNGLRLLSAECSLDGSKLLLEYNDHSYSLSTPFVGAVYLSNLMAAFACVYSVIKDKSDIVMLFNHLNRIPGRMGVFTHRAMPNVIVDYAHNIDGIKTCLTFAKDNTKGKLWVIFGVSDCTDNAINIEYTSIIEEIADHIIVTESNSYYAPFQQVVDNFAKLYTRTIKKVYDRRDAILSTISLARMADTIVILGKGSQEYTIRQGEHIKHSDVKCVESCYICDEV